MGSKKRQLKAPFPAFRREGFRGSSGVGTVREG